MAGDRAVGNAEGRNAFFSLKSAEGRANTHVYICCVSTESARNCTKLSHGRLRLIHVPNPNYGPQRRVLARLIYRRSLPDTVKPWETSKVEPEKLWKLSEELVGGDLSPKIK